MCGGCFDIKCKILFVLSYLMYHIVPIKRANESMFHLRLITNLLDARDFQDCMEPIVLHCFNEISARATSEKHQR